MQLFLVMKTRDPTIYSMDHHRFIVSNQGLTISASVLLSCQSFLIETPASAV